MGPVGSRKLGMVGLKGVEPLVGGGQPAGLQLHHVGLVALYGPIPGLGTQHRGPAGLTLESSSQPVGHKCYVFLVMG